MGFISGAIDNTSWKFIAYSVLHASLKFHERVHVFELFSSQNRTYFTPS